MGQFKALTLAGAFVLATAGAALAADLLPPPAPVEAVPDVEFSGWYIRGDVGVGINSMNSWKSSFQDTTFVPTANYVDVRREQRNIGDSAFLRAGIGYQVNNWFRADVTGEYRTSASYTATESYRNTGFAAGPSLVPLQGCAGPAAYNYDTVGGVLTANNNGAAERCYDRYNANVRSAVVLANGYFDLGTWNNLTPYVGAGIGAAYNMMSGITDQGNSAGFGQSKSVNKTNLAWALMTGVSYSVTQNLKLELGYRYLNMGSINSNPIVCNVTVGCHYEVQKFKLASNDIHIGMRWMLGGATPVSQPLNWEPHPGPLVKRY